MKASDLRDMDVESLRAKTQEIDDQLFRMRIQKSMGQLEAPGTMRTIKRERARNPPGFPTRPARLQIAHELQAPLLALARPRTRPPALRRA